MKKVMIWMLLLMSMTAWAAKSDLKPRLVVCTDIAPADVEPDDMESMVRLMAYADCFEIEALITSVGWNCDPYPLEWQQYLFRVITAYAKDVPNLMKRSGQKKHLSLKKENGSQELGYWPSADYIKSRAVMGSEHGGIKVIGEGNDSPGSELLIRLADEDDPRPIYVAAWRVVALANGADAAIDATHDGTAAEIVGTGPIADVLASALFIEWKEGRLFGAHLQIPDVDGVGIDDLVQVLRPINGVGVTVPTYGRDERFYLKTIGIRHQPHHRLHVVWLHVGWRNVRTYH